jgi:ElaB/YqjD/DUF883 family membrane-anchored ribosome-binding protein
MDQGTGHAQRQMDERQAAVTENMGQVEAQVQEIIDRVTSTLEGALKGFKQVQDTVDGAKAAVDEVLERVTGTVHETVERVQPTADLLEHVQQNPWLLLGGAILMGYLLARLARESASPR